MAKRKVTKSQIIEGLKAMSEKFQLTVEAQSILDYTLDAYEENARNVTMDDLKEVKSTMEKETGRQLIEFIADGESAEAPVETMEEAKAEAVITKVEAKTRGKSKITPKKATTDGAEAKAENQVKDSKPLIVAKKQQETFALDKEEETKVETPKPKETTKKVSKPDMDFLAGFPNTLESKALKGTLKLRNDLATIQDVVKAFNNDEDIIIATYWTKKLLKQYAQGYDPMGINPNKPKSFEHDLDLIEITYANDLVVTGCSLYSYVPQILLPGDFEQDEDGMRYANGVEFQVYEVVTSQG